MSPSNNHPSGDSANAGVTIVKWVVGLTRFELCDLPVISRTPGPTELQAQRKKEYYTPPYPRSTGASQKFGSNLVGTSNQDSMRSPTSKELHHEESLRLMECVLCHSRNIKNALSDGFSCRTKRLYRTGHLWILSSAIKLYIHPVFISYIRDFEAVTYLI